MPKLCPNITFPHQQDFFPIRSVTKSSTARFSLVETFKIFVQDFVPIRTALSTCQKKIVEGHSIEIVWYIVPAASHPIPSPDRSHAPKRVVSTTTRYSQGFRFLYRHSRRRLGSPWVGPVHAALKRLKLATIPSCFGGKKWNT